VHKVNYWGTNDEVLPRSCRYLNRDFVLVVPFFLSFLFRVVVLLLFSSLETSKVYIHATPRINATSKVISQHTTHHPSPITHHPSPITHHPSPITHHASRITYHASRITHHRSHITYHISHILIYHHNTITCSSLLI
jgi:hypothetical protein